MDELTLAQTERDFLQKCVSAMNRSRWPVLTPEPVTYRAAKRCKRGHAPIRYLTTGNCVACAKAHARHQVRERKLA